MTQTAVFQDRYGLPLSTSSPAAVEHYVAGLDRLLSTNAGAEERMQAAIAADDGFALAHAALAFLHQFRGRGQEARASADRAAALVEGATRRERGQVGAITAAVAGDAPRALDLLREHLAEFPRDALSLFQASSALGMSGGPDREAERLALIESLAPAYGDDWYFHGAYSFALHEVRRFEQSRRLSERSLELYPRNAGASHNVAHVFYETVDNDSGAGFLDGWIAGYDREAPLHCHLAWHLALFHLAAGRYGRVMEIYDRDISPAVVQQRITLMDSSSLLWRWQMYGCAEGPLPWGAVRDLAGRMAARAGYAFGDAHAALAFAAAGDAATLDRLIDGWRGLDAKGHPLAGVMLPLIHGAAAFARGEYAATIRHIAPVAADIHRIGGSHAQWELWEEILTEAYLRAGRCEEAITILRRRLDRRSSARDYFWLGRAQAAAGSPDATALIEARRIWSAAERHAPEQARLEQLRGEVAVLADPPRLAALRRLGLLDTPPDEVFDRLTRLASEALRTPIALLTLVDTDRQFFKSAVGLPEPVASQRQTPLTHSFCKHAVAAGAPLRIRDVRDVPLVRDNLAIPEFGVVAYAGIPLLTADGYALGTLCVIDTRPRAWTDAEIELLEDLAAAAMTEIDRYTSRAADALADPDTGPEGHDA